MLQWVITHTHNLNQITVLALIIIREQFWCENLTIVRAYIHICSFRQQELHHLRLTAVRSVVQGLSTTLQRPIHILILQHTHTHIHTLFKVGSYIPYTICFWGGWVDKPFKLSKLFPMNFTEKRKCQNTDTHKWQHLKIWSMHAADLITTILYNAALHPFIHHSTWPGLSTPYINISTA